MRISDWSSDVCSSDLILHRQQVIHSTVGRAGVRDVDNIGSPCLAGDALKAALDLIPAVVGPHHDGKHWRGHQSTPIECVTSGVSRPAISGEAPLSAQAT